MKMSRHRSDGLVKQQINRINPSDKTHRNSERDSAHKFSRAIVLDDLVEVFEHCLIYDENTSVAFEPIVPDFPIDSTRRTNCRRSRTTFTALFHLIDNTKTLLSLLE